MDYAMLSRVQMQSTSDQQDFLLYAAIAVAAPAAVAPEQAAIWAYPQPSLTDDEISFTLCNALLGRIYLSGHIDQMTPPQRNLVAEAVGIYKAIRADLAGAVPFWPLGLPQWAGRGLALEMRAPEAAYVTAWRRAPEDRELARIDLPIPTFAGPGRRPRFFTRPRAAPGPAGTQRRPAGRLAAPQPVGMPYPAVSGRRPGPVRRVGPAAGQAATHPADRPRGGAGRLIRTA